MTNKFICKISGLLMFFALALMPGICAAEAAFKFTLLEKNFEISDETLSSFKAAGKLQAKSLIENQADSKSLLANYLGATKIPTPAPQYQNLNFQPKKIYAFLKTLSPEVNVIKTEPALEIENGRAINFSPPKEGLTLNLYDTMLKTLETLKQDLNSQPLLMETDSPQNNLPETNSLGINELVATGESNFKGSPKNRIHNIKVGIEKFKGIIIKPGEEFSFNQYLGPVEEEEGFLPELVIKATGTVPELGGGLCQVSSTTFRAAMHAGLPITQRKNHAYAVQYYSPQGTDATIYPGSVDLKFINDTPGSLMVWPYIKDAYKLVFEFYGTKDARQVTLEKPVQYDRKPDGSLKAEWTRIVENKGKKSTSTFKSIYLSPALFHKEEIFPTTTPPNVTPISNTPLL